MAWGPPYPKKWDIVLSRFPRGGSTDPGEIPHFCIVLRVIRDPKNPTLIKLAMGTSQGTADKPDRAGNVRSVKTYEVEFPNDPHLNADTGLREATRFSFLRTADLEWGSEYFDGRDAVVGSVPSDYKARCEQAIENGLVVMQAHQKNLVDGKPVVNRIPSRKDIRKKSL